MRAERNAAKLKGRSPKEGTPGKLKMMIYSKSGVGKTWLAMDFPAPFYIDAEGGARLNHYQKKLFASGGAYYGVDDGALNFVDVLGQIQALATEHHPYRTLAIGSITKLYQAAIAHEAEKLGDKDFFGASKKPAIAHMRRLISWIQRLDMNVLFEAHEISEWGINPKTGQREETGHAPDVWEKLIYELDLTLRLEKRGSSRVAVVRKSRLLGFPEGDVFPLDYAEFSARYGMDYITRDVVPVPICTEAQVEEINKLLLHIRVEDTEIDKILSRASAESWADLTMEQATATIKWLKNKGDSNGV